MRVKDKKQCAQCNDSFSVTPSTQDRVYCSKRCFYLSRKGSPASQRQRKGIEDYWASQRNIGLRSCTSCGLQKEEEEFSGQRSKYKNTGTCLDCKRKSGIISQRKHIEERKKYWKERYSKNRERVRKVNRLSVSKNRFGIDRDELIADDTQCERCGRTQVENLELTGVSLNIHHKDDRGRRAQRLGEEPNNDPSNFEILCSSCHTAESNKARLLSIRSDAGKKAWATRLLRYGSKGVKTT